MVTPKVTDFDLAQSRGVEVRLAGVMADHDSLTAGVVAGWRQPRVW